MIDYIWLSSERLFSEIWDNSLDGGREMMIHQDPLKLNNVNY